MMRLAVTCLFAASASASVPSVLSFTGTVSDTEGRPVDDATYDVTFRIFDAPNAGTEVWVEPLSLPTLGGVFTALLGAGAVPLDPAAFDAGQVWLEVEAEGDVLEPRLKIVSVPYALLAATAETARSVECTGCIDAGQIDATAVQLRVAGSCAGGESVIAVNMDGSVSCAPGVTLAGGGLASTAARSDHTHAGTYLPLGAVLNCGVAEKVLSLDPLTGSVACAPDQQTVYTAGAGISVAGTTLSTSFAGVTCSGDERLSGFDVAGDPICSPPPPSPGTQLPRSNSRVALDPVGSAGRSTSVTTGADGLPVISHHDAAGGDLRVVKCGDPACASGNTATLVDGVGVATGDHSSIAIGTDGNPVISYYDIANGDLRVAKCGDPACTAGNTFATPDGAAADVGRFTSIAIGTDGFPVVSYRDVTNLDLKVAKCADLDCSAPATVTPVDGAGINVGEYTSIAIGADGLPVISYYDVGATNLKVAKCSDVLCSAPAVITTVDGGGADVGRYSSIAVAGDGLPIIAHYSASAGRLRAVKCSDPACAGSSAAVVDSSADVGAHASISIGVDGLPVIAYHDVTAGTLKVAHCGSAACSSGNTLTVVDASAVTGHFTSITVGGDGLPLISYRDVSGDGLRAVKCNNAFCLDNWSRR